jgi:hypothetical protein
MTKADRARLKALAARPDSEIDTGDIPEMTDERWKNAKRGHFYRPRKLQITAAKIRSSVLALIKRRLLIARSSHTSIDRTLKWWQQGKKQNIGEKEIKIIKVLSLVSR